MISRLRLISPCKFASDKNRVPPADLEKEKVRCSINSNEQTFVIERDRDIVSQRKTKPKLESRQTRNRIGLRHLLAAFARKGIQELDSRLEKWKESEVVAFTRCSRSDAENVLEYCFAGKRGEAVATCLAEMPCWYAAKILFRFDPSMLLGFTSATFVYLPILAIASSSASRRGFVCNKRSQKAR